MLSWLQIGAFFLINLCLVVIATQFSETKKREMSRMLAERKRFQTSSSSTLASSSEPGGCYDELIKYASHIARKVRRRLHRLARRVAQNHRRRRVTPERAAVAVSLRRRRRRRRHGGKARRRAESVHHPAPPLGPLNVTPSSSRRSFSSPVCPRSEPGHVPVRSSPKPGPSQRHVEQVQLQQALDQQQHLEQQQQAARRPDFLKMPSHDSVGYASIVSVLSWSSLPTPSVNFASPPPQKAPPPVVAGNSCQRDSEDSDSLSTTRYLVLPLELISVSPQSRRASSASAYLQDFCCLSPEQQLVLERAPAVSAVERVWGSVLRSESLGATEPLHPTAAAATSRATVAASRSVATWRAVVDTSGAAVTTSRAAAATSRHWFAHRASSFAGETLPPSPLAQSVHPVETGRDEVPAPTAAQATAHDGVSWTSGTPTPGSPPSSSSSVRRNSVNRASSLSSATAPPTKSNFLAVPAPVIGAGARRASVIRARSLGNEDLGELAGVETGRAYLCRVAGNSV